MRKMIILLSFVILLLFKESPAQAQLFLEEGKVNLLVSGGERINKSITVDNTTKDEMDIRVYWEDFQYESPFDGTKKFLPAGTADGSASSWVQYMPQDFKIQPFQKQKVNYTVNVPSDIKGGHYGVLFFEKSGGALEDAKAVKVVTRIGCLFFIEAKDREKRAAIGDVVVTGNDLSGTFTNSGNVILIPRTTYYIMDGAGMVADRGELSKLYVPSGAVASWQVSLPKNLSEGQYSLVVNSDLDDGDIVVKEITLRKTSSGEFIVEKVQD